MTRLSGNDTSQDDDDELRFYDTITLTELKEFRFLHPIEFLVGGEEGVLLVCDTANLYGYGKTMEDALEDVYMDLEHVWSTYAMGDESDFHESAIAYKHWLLENVERRDTGPPRALNRLDIRTPG